MAEDFAVVFIDIHVEIIIKVVILLRMLFTIVIVISLPPFLAIHLLPKVINSLESQSLIHINSIFTNCEEPISDCFVVFMSSVRVKKQDDNCHYAAEETCDLC